jgi:hypothetical protein
VRGDYWERSKRKPKEHEMRIKITIQRNISIFIKYLTHRLN